MEQQTLERIMTAAALVGSGVYGRGAARAGSRKAIAPVKEGQDALLRAVQAGQEALLEAVQGIGSRMDAAEATLQRFGARLGQTEQAVAELRGLIQGVVARVEGIPGPADAGASRPEIRDTPTPARNLDPQGRRGNG